MEIKENTKIRLCGFVEAVEDKQAELEESIQDLKMDVANTIALFLAAEFTRIVAGKSYYDLRREETPFTRSWWKPMPGLRRQEGRGSCRVTNGAAYEG